MKKVTVVIPAFNEGDHIARTLDSAREAAAYAGLDVELRVVDNGSCDDTCDQALEQGAQVLEHPGLSIGALRNAGAIGADSEFLAFLDADIELPVTAFHAALVQLGKGFGAVALDCDTPSDAPWYARAWQMRSMSPNGRDRELAWLATPNVFMTTTLFAASGGFDEQLRSGEDKEFGLRLHGQGVRQIMLATPLALHWGYEASWEEWLRKEFWRQGSHVQLLRQKLTLRLLRFPLICVLVLLLSLLTLIALYSGWNAGAVLALCGSVLPALGFALKQSVRRKNLFYSVQLTLLHWLRMHVGAFAFLQALLPGKGK